MISNSMLEKDTCYIIKFQLKDILRLMPFHLF